MTIRLRSKFGDLKAINKTALVTFTMAFDPDEKASQLILESLPQAGADIIELGMPFSDPMADGIVIQNAAIRALESKSKLKNIIKMVEKFRLNDKVTPIILMGYINPILTYGMENFVHDTASAGVDGFIIVDLPPEEDGDFLPLCEAKDLALIKLVTPTTDEERLKIILKKARGFIYYVAVTGVTGTKSADIEHISKSIDFIKAHTDLPVAVGFGIKDAISAKKIAKYSDAIVIGSALINKITSDNDPQYKNSLAFVKEIALAIAYTNS